MLALHYYSNAKGVGGTLRRVTAAWWSQDDDPVYSKDLIKEFEVENPPLENELAWILKKGISRTTSDISDHPKRIWYRVSLPTGIPQFRVQTLSLMEFSLASLANSSVPCR